MLYAIYYKQIKPLREVSVCAEGIMLTMKLRGKSKR